MVRQVQYQIRAEPVLPEELRPETTLISKWFVQASEPVRVKPHAVDVGGIFETVDILPVVGAVIKQRIRGFVRNVGRLVNP